MKKKIIRLIFLFILIIGSIGAFISYQFYQKIYQPNVKSNVVFYIPSGFNYENVFSKLKDLSILKNYESFDWLAQQMKYTNAVKAGKYNFTKGMSNRELLVKLRSGDQTPVRLTFIKFRLKEQLVQKFSKKFEFDSLALSELINNEDFIKSYGFENQTVIGMFIPNTYEFWWNTKPEEFFKKMNDEYEKFWNDERFNKAEALNLTPMEVIIIASIVEEETNKNDEKARVAGVYLNRLKNKWRLDADPTLKYAVGDFTIKRVLNIHKETKSPYNTYKNAGLPPGPICTPSIASIDAVLNAEKHNFMFFCASVDKLGYHAFAKTKKEHNLNAARYHKYLNSLKK